MAQQRHYPSAAQRQAAYRQRTALAQAEQLQARDLPRLPAIATIPGWTRWRGLLQHAYQALRLTATEMEQYSQARSDAWQESERGESFQERLDAVLELVEAIERFGGDYDATLPATA
jgi:hypothetical protein